MGSSPISGIGFCSRVFLPAASSPISGTSEALAFWPSFRERRSTRLVPCSPWTGPTLASPGGSPSRLSPGTTLLLPFFLRRFRGALRTDERVGPGPDICPPRALPIALQREASTPEDSRKQFPPPYFLSVSLAAIWHPSGAFFILRQVTVVTLYQGKPSQKKTRARRLFARGRRTAPPPLEVWNGTAKRAHLQVALLAERHVPIKLYAALQRK